ncbi:hypothetical protein BV25DRAFT_1765456, partial [Artomyces pyxidatus]
QSELEHRRVKRFYARTNKQQFTSQITKHQQRERLLKNIKIRSLAKEEAVEESDAESSLSSSPESDVNTQDPAAITLAFEEEDPLAPTPPTLHHHMSDSTRFHENIISFVGKYSRDPATQANQNFLPRLKDHLLGRLLGRQFQGDEEAFSAEQRASISFVHGRMYKHKVVRFNYTTYDMR